MVYSLFADSKTHGYMKCIAHISEVYHAFAIGVFPHDAGYRVEAAAFSHLAFAGNEIAVAYIGHYGPGKPTGCGTYAGTCSGFVACGAGNLYIVVKAIADIGISGKVHAGAEANFGLHKYL